MPAGDTTVRNNACSVANGGSRIHRETLVMSRPTGSTRSNRRFSLPTSSRRKYSQQLQNPLADARGSEVGPRILRREPTTNLLAALECRHRGSFAFGVLSREVLIKPFKAGHTRFQVVGYLGNLAGVDQ